MNLTIISLYHRIVLKHPKIVLIIISSITLLMGYFASQASFSSHSRDFMPENIQASALDEVRSDFGADGQKLIALFEGPGGALDSSNLLSQLALEERINNSELASLSIEQYQSGQKILSPANIVVYARVYGVAIDVLLEHYPTIAQGPVPGKFDGQHSGGIRQELGEFIVSLPVEEKRIVLQGGSLTLDLAEMSSPIELFFSPYHAEELGAILQRAPFSHFLEMLLSRDYSEDTHFARFALLSIAIPRGLSSARTLALEELFESLSVEVMNENPSVKIRVLGQELTSKAINTASFQSMWYLIGFSGGLVILILSVTYRRFVDVLVNCCGLLMAVICTFGLGTLLEYRFNPILATVPVLVIGLGIDYGLHLTLRYREEIIRGHSISKSFHVTLLSVGFALVLTTLTTASGFLSNTIVELEAIRQFGVLAALSLLSAFVIMVTIVPATKIIVDRRREKKQKPLIPKLSRNDLCISCLFNAEKRHERQNQDIPLFECTYESTCNKAGFGFGAFMAQYPLPVIAVVLCLTLFSGYFVLHLETRFDYRDFLPEHLELTETYTLFFNEFQFSNKNAFLLSTGTVESPLYLAALQRVKDVLLQSPAITRPDQFESPLELARKLSDFSSPAFNSEFSRYWSEEIDQDFDGLPDSSTTSAQIGGMYDRLFQYVPEQAVRVLRKDGLEYTGALIRVPVVYKNDREAHLLTTSLNQAATPITALSSNGVLETIATGEGVVTSSILNSLRTDQMKALSITLGISLLVLTGVYLRLERSFLLGLITMAPLLFVIIWGSAAMFFLGIPLNVITMTIASLTVGLGLTYGIHVTQRFLEDVDRTGDADCALCITVTHTGKALFGSAATTAAGFGILSFAVIPPLSQFGVIAAINIGLAFLAALYIQPTFLMLWWNRKNVSYPSIFWKWFLAFLKNTKTAVPAKT